MIENEPTLPPDRELEALLREQALLPLPLPLVGRILAQVLPVERQNPWVVAVRAAAAILVFCASWLAFSGEAPALADIAPEARVAAALPGSLAAVTGAPLLADLPTPGTDPVDGSASATLWLVLGVLVLVGGALLVWRISRRERRGPDA